MKTSIKITIAGIVITAISGILVPIILKVMENGPVNNGPVIEQKIIGGRPGTTVTKTVIIKTKPEKNK